jgi:hypothetical protein
VTLDAQFGSAAAAVDVDVVVVQKRQIELLHEAVE